jgi:hypothetical protein
VQVRPGLDGDGLRADLIYGAVDYAADAAKRIDDADQHGEDADERPYVLAVALIAHGQTLIAHGQRLLALPLDRPVFV